MLRRGVDTKDAFIELGHIQIDLDDAPLGPDGFNQRRDPGLKRFAQPCAAMPEIDVLDRLLRQGGCPAVRSFGDGGLITANSNTSAINRPSTASTSLNAPRTTRRLSDRSCAAGDGVLDLALPLDLEDARFAIAISYIVAMAYCERALRAEIPFAR